MSAVDFEPETGRLRLGAEEFEALARTNPAATNAPAVLRGSGLIVAGGLHPLLAPGLAAVRSPLCQLRASVAGPGGTALHQGWINGEAAAFLLDSGDERYEFLTLAPAFIPAVVARVLRLGPRRSAASRFGALPRKRSPRCSPRVPRREAKVRSSSPHT